MRSSRTCGVGVPELRQVTSTVHPGRFCQPCALCKKGNQSKYSHPKSWRTPLLLQQLQQFEPSLNVQPESCICQACRRDVVNLNNGDNSFTPRWRKPVVVKSCIVNGCTNSEIKVTTEMELEAFIQFFDCAYEPDNESIPLCILHYNKWYRHTHHHLSHIKCKTCGKNIDDSSKSRPVPEPQLLQQFLQENTEFTSTFDDEDRVCCACYQSHMAIVKHIKQSVQSTDSDLKNIISTIKHSLGTVGEIQTFESAVEYAARLVAIDVGEALLNQTAILLPQAYDIFREKLMSFPEVIINREPPSHLWLRTQLSSLLEHHMAFRCCIPKHGTILYRYGGDMLHALSV